MRAALVARRPLLRHGPRLGTGAADNATTLSVARRSSPSNSSSGTPRARAGVRGAFTLLNAFSFACVAPTAAGDERVRA